MSIFKGSGVAIVTPMHDNGEVNYEQFAKLLEFQIANGTDAIIVCGTTGESSTLSHEEHLEVIRYCIEKVAGRIPVVAGTGSNCTETAVYLSREAEKYGADALLLVTPYYNKATQPGLIAHYTQIAQAVSLPIILYNVPGRTGCNLLPETVAYLYQHVENITGLKEATGNITQASKTMDLTDGRIDMYSGEDAVILPLLAIGALGVISVWSNVAPMDVHNLCQSFFDGDLETSRKLQRKGLALIDALFSEVSPIPVKKAMNLMGMEVGPLRAPLCEMSEAGAKKLEEVMKAYGLC